MLRFPTGRRARPAAAAALLLSAAALCAPGGAEAQSAKGTAPAPAPAAAPASAAANAPSGVPSGAMQVFAGIVDQLNLALMRFGIIALRNEMDLTYASLTSDVLAGRTDLVGLELHLDTLSEFPDFGHGPDAPRCILRVERAQIAGLPLAEALGEKVRGEITLVGVTAPLSCVRAEAARKMQLLGFREIAFERGVIGYDYDLASSALRLDATLSAADLADLHLAAEFDYAWVRMPAAAMARGQANAAEPALRLSAAELKLEDRGALDKAASFLRAQRLGPDEAAAMVELQLTAMMQGQTGLLTPQQTQLAAEAGQAVGDFLREGGALRLALSPETPTMLPSAPPDAALMAALNPSLSRMAAEATAAPAIPLDVMIAAMTYGWAQQSGGGGDADAPRPSPEVAEAVATALLTGIGAPYSPETAAAVIAPFVSVDAPNAARIAARAKEKTHPAEAYAAALAGWGDAESAADPALRAEGVALLDRLETQLALADILGAQGQVGIGEVAEGFPDASPAELRRMAHDAAEGRGVPRHYMRAWALASMAAALGDAPAGALRESLDRRLEHRDPEAWRREVKAVNESLFPAWADRLRR